MVMPALLFVPQVTGNRFYSKNIRLAIIYFIYTTIQSTAIRVKKKKLEDQFLRFFSFLVSGALGTEKGRVQGWGPLWVCVRDSG
jgi:hypothetical protein